ncbi:hypothetical protein O181_001311 [Austropuccinia psidii MF-1]|uniref:Uncharacterized protein n=1 Tax=Austropuccinia psidii MF-1 TaxID=1389203 RepID=A0A9Q3BA19_9BASI|nr:hypothetical protein [Austropuccinia psidii MF-1]
MIHIHDPKYPWEFFHMDMVTALSPSGNKSYNACLKWDNSHKVSNFKVGDLVLVSTLNSNNIKGPKKLKYAYVGPFIISALHGNNSVHVELSGELENKKPTFPVILIEPYQPGDKELFCLRNPTPLTVPPVEQHEGEKKKIGDLGLKI